MEEEREERQQTLDEVREQIVTSLRAAKAEELAGAAAAEDGEALAAGGATQQAHAQSRFQPLYVFTDQL